MLMKKILLLALLIPILVFGQTDKKKYIPTNAVAIGETTIVDECNFSYWKVSLINTGQGQKIDSDKGRYANERLRKCRLTTINSNWMVGSTEVNFQDKMGNEYWVYVDNDKLNFHDWTINEEYFLYVRVLEGPNRLIFLDDIE